MPVRVRHALTLWEHGGAYYAIPDAHDDASLPLRQWAASVRAVPLLDRVRAGTVVQHHRNVDGVLVECRVASRWVLVPRWCVEGSDR